MVKTKLLILLAVIINLPAGAQVIYEFRNLGPSINSPQDEFLPVVYNDTLYYRATITSGRRSMLYEIRRIACKDIDQSYHAGLKPEAIPVYRTKDYQPSSKPVDEMASTKPTMKADPSTPSFYSFTSDKLSIYKLANPETLDFGISTEYNDMQPAVSPDGNFIVFASDRPKKRGTTEREKELDLYISFRKPDNSWTKPQNLGKKINTSDNDMAPFIAVDGTLYFSSKGYVRDNVNIIFSGEKKTGKKNLSDVYLIREKKNYNIIKAEPTGNQKEPFANPVLLPAPFNTEFNEIGAAAWKDTMLYIASDRLEPYDRPDPLNKSGYDLYGYVADALPQQPQPPPSVAFFVTGYYKPNTPENLAELRKKFFLGIFGTNQVNDYVADPNHDYDENDEPIDYDAYSIRVDEYFNSLMENLGKWLEFLEGRGRGNLEITVNGYTDPRPLSKESRYLEKSIRDSTFDFEYNNEAAITNDSLSLLRAYFTAKHIKKMLSENPAYQDLAERIAWKIEGKGVYESNDPNEKKRKFDVLVSYY